jgi:hypothetical protein
MATSRRTRISTSLTDVTWQAVDPNAVDPFDEVRDDLNEMQAEMASRHPFELWSEAPELVTGRVYAWQDIFDRYTEFEARYFPSGRRTDLPTLQKVAGRLIREGRVPFAKVRHGPGIRLRYEGSDEPFDE